MFEIPTGLLSGPLQILLFLIAAALAVISYRQRSWKSAADAAGAELGIWKAAADRLGAENRALIATNTALQCKTDLAPILEAIKQAEAESRRYFEQTMQRLASIHVEQTDAMLAVTAHLTELTHRQFAAK